MNQSRTKYFIIVNGNTYEQISNIVQPGEDTSSDPKINKSIRMLLKGSKKTVTNPIPHENTIGMLWNGNLILREP